MRRAIALAAAILMLLATFAPQPVTPQAKTAQTPSKHDPHDYDARRDPFLDRSARSTRPAVQTVTVARGDTYSRWATTYCGTFAAWTSIQAVNGWPERRIPVGATATINCTAPAKVVTPASTPALASTSATSSAWVHPLASGKRAESSGLCWGAPRSGHRHAGTDLTQPSGTDIRSVTAGIVKLKAYSATAGHYVVIAHAGDVYSRYMHMRAPSPLAVGTRVTAGQTIGYVGATGNAKGPHLHFEILQGGTSTRNAVNPAVFMRKHGVNIGC